MGTAYVTIQGNLTENPKFRKNTPGHELTKFRLATSGRRRTDDLDANGQPIWQDTDQLYIDVECWGQLAKNCAVSLRKGFPVTVAGKLVTHTWEEQPERPEGASEDPDPILRSKILLKATQVSFDLSNFQVSSIKTSSVSNTIPGSQAMVVQDAVELYEGEERLSAEDSVVGAGVGASQPARREPAYVGAASPSDAGAEGFGGASGEADPSFDDDAVGAANRGDAPF